MIRNEVSIPVCVGFAFLMFGATSARAEAEQDVQSHAPSFTLEDQYGATHEYAFPRERVLLVTIGGRDSTEDMDPWLETLHEAYDGKIDFQGIAQLSSVPYLARKLARAAIRYKSTLPVLCDWSGEVCQEFGAIGEVANVLVVSPDGRIYYHAKGAMTDAALNEVRAAIDHFLDSESDSEPAPSTASSR